MNLNIAKNRIASVTRPDSIATSREDFFATHMPLNNILELNSFVNGIPASKEYCNEEQVLQKYIVNSKDQYRFITIYGESGSGKSHLIRWLNEKYEAIKPKDEVVLFISRSDNTLKGTINQLLSKPEIKNIVRKELIEKLSKASTPISENKLKDSIYHQFQIEIKDDIENGTRSDRIKLKTSIRRKLIPFLKNDLIQENLMKTDGPIERIYAKVAQQAIVDRDLEAKFLSEDFYVDINTQEDMLKNGADSKAYNLACTLSSEDWEDTASTIAEYMNSFVNQVIQYCTGIGTGDIKDLFEDIRVDLKKSGKNLTLFIEDITSFTGVNLELLDALMELGTGMTENKQMCRLSSIVGTTTSFLSSQFRDNHKDRVDKYLYIPQNQFNNDRLYEFVGRYLNAMSLSIDTLKTWVNNGAHSYDYPIADVVEGKEWEYVDIKNDKKLNLYPFTKKAIENLYKQRLVDRSMTTPRYIIRDIIAPVVEDIMYNKSQFPDKKYNSNALNPQLVFSISQNVTDEEKSGRLTRFVHIWGNSKNSSQLLNGEKYTCGIKNSIYEELDLPILDFDIEIDSQEENQKNEDKTNDNPSEKTKTEFSSEAMEKVSKANDTLTEWINGAKINISATTVVSNILKKAREDLESFVITGINWQIDGLDLDLKNKINNSSINVITLVQTTRNVNGLYKLPNTIESYNLLLSFVKYREYGKQSWNYEGSELDVFIFTSWMFKHKNEIIDSIKTYQQHEVNYIKYAIASEIYRLMINGEFRERNFAKLNIEYFFGQNVVKGKSNSHSKKWNSLIERTEQENDGLNNRESIQLAYNIVQGYRNTGKVVINEPEFKKMLRSVKTNMFNNKFNDDICLDDPITSRKKVFTYYNAIKGSLSEVIESEKQFAKENITVISEAFDQEKEIEDYEFDNLMNSIDNFYKEANKTQINITMPNLDQVKRNSKLVIAAYNSVQECLDSDEELKALLTFSGNPLERLIPLKQLIENLKKDIEKVDKECEKISNNAERVFSDEGVFSYNDESDIFKQCNESLLKVGE